MALFAALLLLTGPTHGAAANAPTGIVRGQVSNQATGAFLEDARVEVKSANGAVTTTTDREGRFQAALPPGPAALRVRYSGLDTQEVAIDVPPGGSVTRNVELTAGVYKMESFTVASGREGSAAAIMRQQQAPNVKNVVASDSFGNVADGNIGDFLQQLPGVTGVYVGADVRAVMVRGIASELNTVTMDGHAMAAAPGTGTTRTFEFEQVSLGLIESIELTKAPTPDMDASSIGGNVNLVTKSAFDRRIPRLITYSIGGVWRPKYMTNSPEFVREPLRDIGPSINLSYSDVFGAKQNIGVTLTFTYHSQPGGDTASLLNYQAVLTDPYYVTSVQAPRPAGAPRTRLATGAKFDYKLSERTVISLNTFLNFFHENNDTRILTQATTALASNYRPGYTSYFQEVLANANSSATIQTTQDDKYGRTHGFQPSVKHKLPGLEIDYAGSYSISYTAWEEGPDDRHSWFGGPNGPSKGRATMTLRNIGFTIDRTRDLAWPTVKQTTGPDMYNLNNYSGMSLNLLDRNVQDKVLAARLNAKKAFETGTATYLKTGLSYTKQDRNMSNPSRLFNYVGADGVQSSADDNLGQFLDTSGQWSDSNHGLRQPPWPSGYKISHNWRTQPQLWREDYAYGVQQFYNNLRRGTEEVSAAYLSGHTRLGPLSILAGLRVERTDTAGDGPVRRVTPEETARRAAWGTAPLTPEETVRRNIAEYGTFRETSGGDYQKVFPGLHFKYEPWRGFVGRASYSTSIGRPGWGSIMPQTVVNDAAQTLTESNTGLRPQYSDNFDVSAEYYFEPAGMVSASVFLKEVKDFIFSDRSRFVGTGPDNGYDGQFVGYNIITSANGGRARYRGFEIAYRQQLTFLPGFWRGFGLDANYTRLETYGDYGGAVATNQVANFIPATANAAISYTGRGWNIRLNAVWRDTTLTAANANAALLRYQKEKLQVNLKTKYNLSSRLGFFLDIENLNRSPITEDYLGREDRPGQTRIVVAKVIGGVQGRF